MSHVEQGCNIHRTLRPLSARSVVLSSLLGAHPPSMTARRLVRVGALFGIAEGTLRVSLSRMTTAGDLRREAEGYALTARLLERQRQQDASRWPRTVPWDGDWRLVAVTATGRSRSDRDTFRVAMRGRRFAELREGLWLRPDNLDDGADEATDGCVPLIGRPTSEPAELAARLWDLTAWADRARLLHDAMADSLDLPTSFAVSAAVLRHLLVDPVLPEELLPAPWPGAELRDRYAGFDERFRRDLYAHLD